MRQPAGGADRLLWWTQPACLALAVAAAVLGAAWVSHEG